MFDSHPKIARELLAHIPRLEPVAEMIGALAEVNGQPADPRVALGVRLLTVALEYDEGLQSGLAEGAAVAAMRRSGAFSDETILSALDRIAVEAGGYTEKRLGVPDLVSGLILAADLYAVDGRLLLTEGTESSLASRTRIEQYAEHVGVREPISVRLPL